MAAFCISMAANQMTSSIMPTYARLPVIFERGEGVWLWDKDGECYLDALSGIAVCGLGHANPVIRETLWEQAGKLIHTSNLYRIEPQEQLAKKLTRLSAMDNVFFCNSGTEANEAAIKIARIFGHKRGIKSPVVITAENSFHGRTLGALSATGNKAAQEGFEPLLDGFVNVPFDDIDALENIAAQNADIVALLLEPIQGEGGIQIPAADYLANVRRICTQNHWLMILDEVQTGIGRTGKFFAYQHNEITPDVCTLAKALGNGVPIGACLATGEAGKLMTAGKHGSTFGGNPLACSVALSVIDQIEQQDLATRATELGTRLVRDFKSRLDTNPSVRQIRGKGLMIGIELDQPCTELINNALENKLLISVQRDHTIRLLPPLIMQDQEADTLVDTLSGLIDEFTLNLRTNSDHQPL